MLAIWVDAVSRHAGNIERIFEDFRNQIPVSGLRELLHILGGNPLFPHAITTINRFQM